MASLPLIVNSNVGELGPCEQKTLGSSALRYNKPVRRAVIVLLIVLIGWTSGDAIFCPDGCADTVAGSAMSPVYFSVGCCILCHGGLTLHPHSPDLLRGSLIREPVTFIAADTDSAPPAPIEHPPRKA